MAWTASAALLFVGPLAAIAAAMPTTGPEPITSPTATAEAAADDDGIQITGQILYDARGSKAPVAAEVDIVSVYASHPAYMHMKAIGSRETDPLGRPLFATAQADVNRALVESARQRAVNVVTVPGGVTGSPKPVPNLTRDVTDRLPVYHVHGEVHYGRAKGALRIGSLDSRAVLAAIPAWQEAQLLDETDARFHLLRHRYMSELNRVVRQAARQGGHDAVVEQGGVTSRLGPVPDITTIAVAAVER